MKRLVMQMKKSLYGRHPYSSMFGVKQFLSTSASYPTAEGSVVNPVDIIDLTSRLRTDGSVEGKLPAGKWTIMRFECVIPVLLQVQLRYRD